jgi:hypothetical protein
MNQLTEASPALEAADPFRALAGRLLLSSTVSGVTY